MKKVTQPKLSLQKRILYIFLFLVFAAIGTGAWIWQLPILLSFIISVIVIAMMNFFWSELKGKNKKTNVEK